MGDQEEALEQTYNFAEAQILILHPVIVGVGSQPSEWTEPITSVQRSVAL